MTDAEILAKIGRVRELRFGKPKTRKTGAVVGSYPTPMLVLNTEMDGLSVVKDRPIKFIKSVELASYLCRDPKDLPPILAIEYIYAEGKRISSGLTPQYASSTFVSLANDINSLFGKCPFTSVVLDSLSGLNESSIGLVGTLNPGAMADARKWAGAAGAKIQEVICALYSLPIPVVVVLAHETTTTNETSQVTGTYPLMVSAIKERVGALASQFFYADTELKGDGSLRFIVRTSPRGFVQGLGQRLGEMPAVCDPWFQDIYGKVVVKK